MSTGFTSISGKCGWDHTCASVLTAVLALLDKKKDKDQGSSTALLLSMLIQLELTYKMPRKSTLWELQMKSILSSEYK